MAPSLPGACAIVLDQASKMYAILHDLTFTSCCWYSKVVFRTLLGSD